MIRRPSGSLGSVGVVLLVAVVLVTVGGAWPPLVAVETGSMTPAVERGDLVVVTATDRFPWSDPAGGDAADPPQRLDGAGDVIVFTSPIEPERPILHRVAFEVTRGEDWTDRGDPGLIDGDCAELATCPAPYDGYVTHGDANDEYDQSAGIAPVVHDRQVHGKALMSVPSVGYLRLGVDEAIDRFGPLPTATGVIALVSVLSGIGVTAAGRVRDGWTRRDDRDAER